MLTKWLRLNWTQRLLLFEAAFNLVGAQLAIRFVPFARIARGLGELGQTPDALTTDPEEERVAQQVGWAVTTLARYAPWDAKCLAQAMAGKWMLQRRRLPSVFYLGVDHGDESWLDAHAWLCCGAAFVTGEGNHERFKILAAFTEDRH